MKLELIEEDDYGQAVAIGPEGALYGTAGYTFDREAEMVIDTEPRVWKPIKAYATKHYNDGGDALEIDWS